MFCLYNNGGMLELVSKETCYLKRILIVMLKEFKYLEEFLNNSTVSCISKQFHSHLNSIKAPTWALCTCLICVKATQFSKFILSKGLVYLTVFIFFFKILRYQRIKFIKFEPIPCLSRSLFISHAGTCEKSKD